ncbi:MAG: hypothetical protein KatS3mg112_0570 [Thermogutta sp.]|nr:MAG: hypothetical protein KatS3mg112_0570 [Thermogutta sp.]
MELRRPSLEWALVAVGHASRGPAVRGRISIELLRREKALHEQLISRWEGFPVDRLPQLGGEHARPTSGAGKDPADYLVVALQLHAGAAVGTPHRRAGGCASFEESVQ